MGSSWKKAGVPEAAWPRAGVWLSPRGSQNMSPVVGAWRPLLSAQGVSLVLSGCFLGLLTRSHRELGCMRGTSPCLRQRPCRGRPLAPPSTSLQSLGESPRTSLASAVFLTTWPSVSKAGLWLGKFICSSRQGRSNEPLPGQESGSLRLSSAERPYPANFCRNGALMHE